MTSTSYPARVDRSGVPATVTLATTFVWVLVGLFVLRAVLTYALFDSLMDHWYESRNSGLPRDFIEDGAPKYKPIALITAVLIGGGLAACAAFLLRGARWARTVTTVVGVLAFLGGIGGMLQPATALFKVIGLIVALVAALAVVLLWLPASSAFFRSGRPARAH